MKMGSLPIWNATLLRAVSTIVVLMMMACGATRIGCSRRRSPNIRIRTTGNIVDSTNCATTVTRTFTVGTNFTVADVNLGVLLSHTYRSDLRITLTSPLGTSVQIMTNVGGAADNLNVLFDDEASAAISSHSVDDTTGTVPPYLRTFRPTAAMTAFDGQNAQGTWTMVICDSVSTDVGTFTRADLYLTSAPASYADLSLTKTVSNANPGERWLDFLYIVRHQRRGFDVPRLRA